MVGDDACDLKEIPIDNKDWLAYLNEPGAYIPHTIGAPVSELFSVRFCPNSKYFQQRGKLEIYGSITLHDLDDNTYEIYSRPRDDPQTLTPQHNLLFLAMPSYCLVSISWSHIILELIDKPDDSVIAKQLLSFDKLTDINQYNKVRQLSYNSIFVTYAAFPAAVLAILEIKLIKTNDSDPNPLNLSAKIVARCGNTYGHKYPGIVLFNTLSNQPIQALSNHPIELQLDRNVVVVPAYSFLRIDILLSQLDSHHQEDNKFCVDFLAKHLCVEHRDIVFKDFVVHFDVHWCHPYELRDETSLPSQPPNVVCLNGDHSPRSLVEVYTVVIHHDTNCELEIFGTIATRDNWLSFLLFDSDGLNPVKVSGNEETIPIVVKRRCLLMSGHLDMGLNLKDVEGHVLIEGQISWSDRNVEKPMSWYDERICSVIRGVGGYAAVYYTIFSQAMQAKVRIVFKCKRNQDISHLISGSVVATHSNETYLTEHDKAYYQSVLWRGNSSDLESDSTLPLSKSVVAVPIDAVLKVAVDLSAKPLSSRLLPEHLNSVFYFNLGSDILRIIDSLNYSIAVSVEWSDLDKLLSEECDFIRKNDYEEVSKLQFTEF